MKQKKILVSVLLCALVMYSPFVLAEASTPSSEYTATLGDAKTHAKSEIWSTGASCLTSITSSGTAAVTGTYSYVNYKTLKTGTKTLGNGEQHYASISFTAPTNCRSVNVCGSHKVTIGAQYWGARTEAIY